MTTWFDPTGSLVGRDEGLDHGVPMLLIGSISSRPRVLDRAGGEPVAVVDAIAGVERFEVVLSGVRITPEPCRCRGGPTRSQLRARRCWRSR